MYVVDGAQVQDPRVHGAAEASLVFEADENRRVDFESETIIRALDFRPTWEIAARGHADGVRRWLRERRR